MLYLLDYTAFWTEMTCFWLRSDCEPTFPLLASVCGDGSMLFGLGAMLLALVLWRFAAPPREVAMDTPAGDGAAKPGLGMLEAFVRQAPFGLAVLDRELRFLEVNEQLARDNGRSPSDHVGQIVSDDFTTFRGEAVADLRRVLQTGQPVLGRVGGDGSATGEVWQSTYFPLLDVEGQVVAVGAVVQKVTDVFWSERQLKVSDAELRQLADAIPHLVWTMTPAGERDYLSRQWQEYTGASIERLVGGGWRDFLHPDDRGRALAALADALSSGEVYNQEYRIRRRDGVYHWFRARGLPIRDGEGRIVRWYGTCTDIDDLRTLQETVREREQRYRSLAEAVPQLIWTASAEGQPDFFNARWYQYTGLSAGESLAQGWAGSVHADDRVAVVGRWQRGLATGDPFEAECRLRSSEGGYRWFLFRAVPQRDDQQRIIRWIGSSTDIDEARRLAEHLDQKVKERTRELIAANESLRAEVVERTRAEERAEMAAVELRRSNAELEKFAYVASHDLQEPLRKIQAFGDRLRTKFREQLAEQGKDFVDRMLASATRMRRLIEDLLSFSRITTKQQPFSQVDLNEVAAGVLSDLEHAITHSQGRVEIGPLPTIEADPVQMRQLFQNLIANGLKFRKPDTPPVVRVTAKVESSPSGPVCRLSFADNGIGFDEIYTDRIFELFQRLHGRNEYEGTGIGLAVCRKIIERHGGTITTQSRPGEGATFTVTLAKGPRDRSYA